MFSLTSKPPKKLCFNNYNNNEMVLSITYNMLIFMTEMLPGDLARIELKIYRYLIMHFVPNSENPLRCSRI